jgi:ribosomal protein L11 methyltransferase
MWEKFPPQPIGPFFIYGTGYKGDVPQNTIPIHLNAATAFGSGEHQTTKGCLLALYDLAQKIEWKHPLDLGCGSGILAIAMAKLKKTNVLAIDNDSESVRVTKENALLNTVGDVIQAQHGNGLEGIHDTFDIIVANILAKPLIMIADMAFKNLCSGGYIILSGLLDWQQKDVEDTYKKAGFTLIKADNYDRWMTLVFQKV